MDIKQFEASLKKEYLNQSNSNHIDYSLFYMFVLKRLFQKEVESVYDIKEAEIYDLLNHIVKWYHRFGSSASPNELLDYKDKVVTCCYWIGEKLTDAERKYNLKKQHNANEIERLYLQSSKTLNSHAARSTAKNNKSQDLIDEAHYKAETKRIERLLESLDEIVKAMQQRIAWLRQEALRKTEF